MSGYERRMHFKKVRRTREEALNQVRFENKYVAIQELHKEKIRQSHYCVKSLALHVRHIING